MIDQGQDFLKQVPWNGTLGQLESETADMAAKCRLQNSPVMPFHLYLPVPLSATILGNFDHSKGIVKFPAGEKISVEYDLGAMEFELQTAVEINPKKGEISFYPPGGAGCVYPM